MATTLILILAIIGAASSSNVTTTSQNNVTQTPTSSTPEVTTPEDHHEIMKEDFMKALIQKFGDNKTGLIYEEGFKEILEKLQIGKASDAHDDHDDHAGHEDHRRKRAAGGPRSRREEGHEDHLLDEAEGHDDHDHDDHDDHDHEDHGDHGDHDEEDHDVTKKCLDIKELMTVYGMNATSGLSAANISEISPALVQQATQGVCAKKKKESKVPERPTMAQSFGYGTLAVAIISAFSVIGIFLVSCQKKPIYKYLLSGMMALAFSALVGDATLHLIPLALGLHVHGDATGPVVVDDHVWMMLLFTGTLYAFYLMEIGMCLLSGNGGHGHSHGLGHTNEQKHDYHTSKLALTETHSDPHAGHSHKPNGNTTTNGGITLVSITNGGFSPSPDDAGSIDSVVDGEVTLQVRDDLSDEKQDEHNADPHMAPMVVIGDAVHNLADGLAIGAAFATSISGGIATSIAVFCHEVPHELGDMAALLSTGMSWKRALLLNVFSACCCFIGLFIGLAISATGDVRIYMFTIAAGMFMYVGLSEMVPELVKFFTMYNKWKVFLAENIGILAGFGIMFAIAVYEPYIQI